MKVATYYNNSDIRIEEAPVPWIGPGELLVKVMASGICGSDVMEWYRIKKAPLVLGHEIAGEVVQIGEGVEGYSVGDRVFVSHHVPCGQCRYCLSGQGTVCDTLRSTNFDPGGFAQFLRVPAINVEKGVFKLPDETSYEEGTFVEPLACVVRGQRRASMAAGKNVLVIGAGISGLIHIALARALGAGRIMATDVSPYRLAHVKEMGADVAIVSGQNTPAQVRERNNGKGADLVIVCTGALQALTQSFECVDRGGTVLFFASSEPQVNVPLPVWDLWKDGINLVTSYGAAPEDIQTAIELLQFGRIKVDKMITHRLGLSDTGLGFRLVAEAGESLKVIIFPQDHTEDFSESQKRAAS